MIELTMPPGFCELDKGNRVDPRALTAIRNLVSGGGNQLLAIAADCSQLTDWRAGKRPLLDDFLQYQTPARRRCLPTIHQSRCSTLAATAPRPADFGSTPAMTTCRFRKPYPFDSWAAANQNMIAE
jgi:hypothetical protein